MRWTMGKNTFKFLRNLRWGLNSKTHHNLLLESSACKRNTLFKITRVVKLGKIIADHKCFIHFNQYFVSEKLRARKQCLNWKLNIVIFLFILEKTYTCDYINITHFVIAAISKKQETYIKIINYSTTWKLKKAKVQE